jgi:hypothetical protein
VVEGCVQPARGQAQSPSPGPPLHRVVLGQAAALKKASCGLGRLEVLRGDSSSSGKVTGDEEAVRVKKLKRASCQSRLRLKLRLKISNSFSNRRSRWVS